MSLKFFQSHSLKSRVTLFTLVIFLISLWSLLFYASHTLREDLEQMLGQQQFASVSLIAGQVNHDFEIRSTALEKLANASAVALSAGTASMQTLLEQNVTLTDLFNFGVLAYGMDGTAVAEVPRSAGRIGLNYLDNATVVAALKEGKSTLSEVHLGKVRRSPVFGITTPIRNMQGQVVGALSGVIDLGKPNFLDNLFANRYGQTGGYLLIAPKQRLIVAATDHTRTMEQLPPRGTSVIIDQFIDGHDGSAIFVNPRKIEVMVSDKRMPDVGWIVSAVLPTEEAFAPIRSLQRRLILATLLLTLLAAALTWWMLRRQLAPMLDTVKTLVNLSNSDKAPQALPTQGNDEFGNLVAGFNRLLDTLSHRQAALTESTQRYRQLVDDLAVGVLIQSPTAEILMSNQLAWELLGLTEDQLLGKTSFDASWNVIHEDGSPFPGDTHPVPQAIATRQAVEHVIMGVFRPTTQNRVWLLVTAKPQFHPDGTLHQVVCTFSNISKRKQAEAALAKSEAFKNTILNSLTAEIAVVDSQGVIQAVNNGWQRFLLDSVTDPNKPVPPIGVGCDYLAACAADGKLQHGGTDDAQNGIRAVLEGRLPSYNLEYPCDSQQQKRWFSMTVVPLGQDVRDGAVITHTDITALKMAAQVEHHRSHILELLAGDQSLTALLEALVRGVEQLQRHAICSILLLSSDGHHLEHAISPGLPDFYNAAVEGIEIGIGVGSCGTAAFTGKRVVVEDINTHPYWVPYRHLANRAGLGSCWSQPICAANGRVLGTFAIYHSEPHAPEAADIVLIEQSARLASIAIEKHRTTQKLRDSEAHFRLLTEQISDVVWRQDQNNVFTYISPADERLRGFRADEVVGQHFSTLLTEEGLATLKKLQQPQDAVPGAEATQAISLELQQRCKDGQLIWTEIISTPERDAQGNITGYHGITREITERKEMQDQVRQLAFFDPLTKLPNRRLLDDRLKQTMTASSRTGRFGALIFLDLDNFKPLNDTHGHDVGDLLLIEVAHRLKACVREMDTVVRIGGDEFVVMLSELNIERNESREQAGMIAEKVRQALAQPYRLSVRREGLPDITVEHHCSASLGVALFVNHDSSQAEVLKWADAAMYAAKDAGRNRVRFHGENAGPTV